MPDVITEATLSLSQMDDLMEDEHPINGGDPMLSHHLLNSPHSQSPNHHHNNNNNNSNNNNHLNLRLHHHHHHHNGDPLLSASNHQNGVDINCIDDPILSSGHNLLSSPHRSHILSSEDTDSLVSDIDMVA